SHQGAEPSCRLESHIGYTHVGVARSHAGTLLSVLPTHLPQADDSGRVRGRLMGQPAEVGMRRYSRQQSAISCQPFRWASNGWCTAAPVSSRYLGSWPEVFVS